MSQSDAYWRSKGAIQYLYGSDERLRELLRTARELERAERSYREPWAGEAEARIAGRLLGALYLTAGL